jgi:hypothetical protein
MKSLLRPLRFGFFFKFRFKFFLCRVQLNVACPEHPATINFAAMTAMNVLPVTNLEQKNDE